MCSDIYAPDCVVCLRTVHGRSQVLSRLISDVCRSYFTGGIICSLCLNIEFY